MILYLSETWAREEVGKYVKVLKSLQYIFLNIYIQTVPMLVCCSLHYKYLDSKFGIKFTNMPLNRQEV